MQPFQKDPGMRLVDLRSDTVTLPTKEMLEAIAEAELADDLYDRDPTVKRLEEVAAQRLGKESGLLVSSGTQGNLVSLMAHTKRGDEVIVEADSHIYYYEVGSVSAVAGLLVKTLKGDMGALNPKDIEDMIRPKDIYSPETTLVCIENTHNRAGGTCISSKQIQEIGDVAKAHSLRLHMDGERICKSKTFSSL